MARALAGGRGCRRSSGAPRCRRWRRRPGTTTRSAIVAADGSWVTMTMVWPKSSTARRRSPRISRPDFESRLPVGSSPKTTAGRVTRARATATRCCWPPDISAGRCVRRSPSPTASISVSSQLAVGALATDAQRQGDVLLGGQDGEQVVGLEDEADRAAPQQREVAVVEAVEARAVDLDPALGRPVEPGEDVQQRRLARARRAHDGREAAGRERHVDASEGVDGRRSRAEALDEVVAADHGGLCWRRCDARHRLGDEGARAHACTIPRARARGDRGRPRVGRANYGTEERHG